MDKVNLLPCAHCGSKNVHLCRMHDATDKTMCWYVECYDCGIRTNSYPEEAYAHDEYAEVITAVKDAISCATESWNKRVSCTSCETVPPMSIEDEFKPLADLIRSMKRFAETGKADFGNKGDE